MIFTKLQGTGNDFVLIEASEINPNWSKMAVAMCDRHFGIGADGLLVLLPSNLADFQMHIFNPDGSEAEACGNGLRCLVRYVIDKGLVNSETQEILIETIAGTRKIKIHRAIKKPTKIQVGMGKPKFGANDIPVAVGFVLQPDDFATRRSEEAKEDRCMQYRAGAGSWILPHGRRSVFIERPRKRRQSPIFEEKRPPRDMSGNRGAYRRLCRKIRSAFRSSSICRTGKLAAIRRQLWLPASTTNQGRADRIRGSPRSPVCVF